MSLSGDQGSPQDASLPVQVEDFLALDEDELHNLVLVDHVDCHVPRVQLGPHQRWAKHDADSLSGHQVFPGETQDSEKQQKHQKLKGRGKHSAFRLTAQRTPSPVSSKYDVYQRELLLFFSF